MATKPIPWVEKAARAIKSGQNVILVHFNIEDDLLYHGVGTPVKGVIEDVLNKKGTVTFDLSGFSFSDDDTERAFRRITGLPVIPEDPGPCPDTENQYQLAQWNDRYQEYQAWAQTVAMGENFGRTPVQCLAPVPADDPFVVMYLLDQFVTTRPAPGAKREDGSPFDEPQDYTLVLDYASFVVPESGNKAGDQPAQKKLEIMLVKWSQMGRDGITTILYANSLTDLSKSLYGRGSLTAVVEVPYPDFDTRYAYMKWLVKERGAKLNGSTIEDMARVASGLSNRHLRSLVNERVSSNLPLDSKTIRALKQEILGEELAGKVELISPEHGFEVIGGLDEVKEELCRVAEYIQNESTPLVPMGILLVGPPGTGKTVLAEAFAKKVGFNFIRPGNIKSKWVGESERNMDEMFRIAKALAPVVIFWDEVDQESGRGAEGDAGVTKHLFGAMLRFMSDTSNRGRILTIAASNRPDLIDPAMKRPGRFDVRIPLLYPDVVERSAIFQVMFTKYDLMADKNINYTDLAHLAADFSGADIECVVLEAARTSERAGKYPHINMAHMVEAMDDYIIHYDRDAIQEMEELAIKECNSVRLLPARYREAVREQKGSVATTDVSFEETN